MVNFILNFIVGYLLIGFVLGVIMMCAHREFKGTDAPINLGVKVMKIWPILLLGVAMAILADILCWIRNATKRDRGGAISFEAALVITTLTISTVVIIGGILVGSAKQSVPYSAEAIPTTPPRFEFVSQGFTFGPILIKDNVASAEFLFYQGHIVQILRNH